jgi:hypothetical protein
MKTSILSLLAGVALLAGCASQVATTPKAVTNVTVTFQDPDHFTDVRENNSTTTSTYYLDALRDYLLQTASPMIAPGQKLVITVTDIDLAGENLFNQPNMIRIVKDIYAPKAKLKFQLLGADGHVVKEGERQLINLNFLLDAGRPGSDEPLYYDKLLLKQWLQDEFPTKS